jgi:leucyl/phenylalanyl-tRNA--protein transferase
MKSTEPDCENQNAPTRIEFPAPPWSPEDDVIFRGGAPTVDNLTRAYRMGIFPWPDDTGPLPWCSPNPRAILLFDRLKVPKSLARLARNHSWRLSVDEAFEEVIKACASVPRKHEDSTWISEEVQAAYCDFHREGFAHSVEVWEGDKLVGGLYGVSVDGTFAGESMFYLRSNASKLAILHLVEHLSARGSKWLDIQMMTPLFYALGAVYVSREDYLEFLALTQEQGLDLFDPVG